MLLAVVPITAGFPHDRLLLFVGVGAMGLLSLLLRRLFDQSLTGGVGRTVGWVLVAVHVAWAALFQIAMSASVAALEPIYADAPRSLPDDPMLEQQRLLIVNTPAEFFGQYTFFVRAFDQRPAPQSQLMLGPGASALVIERLSADTITIEAEAGWGSAPFDILYRARSRPVPAGYAVELSDVRIEVLALTEDGRPRRVRFAFARDLEDESWRWVRFENGRYVPFDVPGVGQRTVLAAVPLNLLAPPRG